MKTFVVIGLGRFGTAVATELCQLGHEVLAIDQDPNVIQQVADQVTHAVSGDARDVAVLKMLGVENYDCGVVAMSSDVGDSALVALNLKDLGVKTVVAKARSHIHRRVLEKLGVDRVVFPEYEMGAKLAQNLSCSNILNFIELSDTYGMVEIDVPRSWVGKTLAQLNVRAKYHVNIIAINRAEEMHISPGGEFVLFEGDMAVAVGRDEDINRLHDL
jgi:trk system potassium uptake protein TrkA